MKVAAIIPAAGLGLRMGSDVPKQYLVLDGKPILEHTLLALEQCSVVSEIVLVVSDQEMKKTRQSIQETHPKVTQVVLGGKERQDSVGNGLQVLDADTDIVVVHDAVRPFASPGLIRETVEAAREWGAAITAIPVTDTVKKVDAQGRVERTVDRNGLWRVQTPQTFQVSLLKEAYRKAREDNFYGTDEGSLIEHLGKPVKVIPGSEFNIKITRPEDLVLGEQIAQLLKTNGPATRAERVS